MSKKDLHACDCGEFDDEKAVKDARSYKHLRQHCVAYQEGEIGCPDCYDFICDACGERKEGKPEQVVNTETLSGVVMCRDCYTPRDFDVVLELRKQYHEEFYSIKHDRPHKEVGRARAAKVHRVPSADEMVAAQQMTAPTNLKWEIEGHYFVPTWEQKDTSKWYNCAHCDAGYTDQECTCKENEE